MMGSDLPGGAVTFHETDKDATSSATGISSRETGSNELISSFASTLLVGTGSTAAISEGVINSYHSTFHDEVDGQDAAGFSSFNTADGLRIKTQGKYLAVERRSGVAETDTIFLTLLNVSQKAYVLQFKANNMAPGITTILQDKFTGMDMPVSMDDTTNVAFNVSADVNSGAADRFRIVFKKSGVLPITFTNINAVKHTGYNAIHWQVENEENVDHYEVEKSKNGINFTTVNNTKAIGNHQQSTNYSWLDNDSFKGENYYRIKSITARGMMTYSKVVKIYLNEVQAYVSLYPNPIRNGQIRLKLMNMAAGNYKVVITNNAGQLVETTTIKHTGGGGTVVLITVPGISGGTYNLNMSGSENFRQVITFLVKSDR